jgi:hypothetical protein
MGGRYVPAVKAFFDREYDVQGASQVSAPHRPAELGTWKSKARQKAKNERRPIAMLNEYHLQFLRLLTERGVRFLVIGGQARFAYHGIATRDLDIRVDLSSENGPALEECLVENRASSSHLGGLFAATGPSTRGSDQISRRGRMVHET